MQEMGISTTNSPTDSLIQAPIHLWFTATKLGHPLIDDEIPLHPLVGPFLQEYLSRFDGMDDEDDEMGHFYTGPGDTRSLARSMLDTWEVDYVAKENTNP